jgi:hypothetical protein
MKGIDRWIREVTQKRIVSLQVVVVLATVLWMVGGPIVPGEAQTPPNSITFDNQSGQNAIVKVVGSMRVVAKVQNGQKRTVHVPTGEYYFLVRYGDSPKEYTYTKSASLEVTQPEDQHSIITITLHRRVKGDFKAESVSGEEFAQVGISE